MRCFRILDAMEATKLSVMLIIPSEIERAGLRLLIEEVGYSVISEASNGESAFAIAQESEPDIAIVDNEIPDVPALGLIHMISRRCPGTQVLLYTAECHRDWITFALREGVRAIVLKSRVSTHLAPALQALADHRPYWEDAVDDALLDELLESGPRPVLTSREWQVLQMAAENRTAKEMARALGVSHRTVESFRREIRRKMGFRSRADLIRYAAQRGAASIVEVSGG